MQKIIPIFYSLFSLSHLDRRWHGLGILSQWVTVLGHNGSHGSWLDLGHGGNCGYSGGA